MEIKNYIDFLSQNKTERECVAFAERELRNHGFKSRKEFNYLQSGDKVYYKNKDKNIAAFIIGKQGIRDKGLNLLGAHIDSPRLDVKTQPLYEDTGMGYFDLQYYGGIKKYQWTARPLAIHGVVCKLDGTKIPVKLGDTGSGYTFCITDLLPHLDKTQTDRKASETIKGEKLDLLLGTVKLEKTDDKDEKDSVKANILKILKDQYNIEEDDFLSAEFEVVPAGDATFVGIDKSMVGGYGQDDRVCAWTSLMALIDVADENEVPTRTSGCVLVDKEEVGSICATGSESRWLEDVLADVTAQPDHVEFGRILANTNMLSSDVSAAYDPLYGEVSNKEMTCKLGGGFMLSKYNGGRGKGGGADANPEFIAAVRKTLNDAGTKYQFDTMGKVDVGGGTIASIVCRLNINVMDAGVPVLNMHSPMEITHVDDITSTYEGYKAFLKSDLTIFD